MEARQQKFGHNTQETLGSDPGPQLMDLATSVRNAILAARKIPTKDSIAKLAVLAIGLSYWLGHYERGSGFYGLNHSYRELGRRGREVGEAVMKDLCFTTQEGNKLIQVYNRKFG